MTAMTACTNTDTYVLETVATYDELPANVQQQIDANLTQGNGILMHGYAVYSQNCVGCHGINGDGLGPAAQRLKIAPRDFTKGIFKFRSTPNGQLPLDADLHRTLQQGLKGSAMPAFQFMPENDRNAVIAFIKLYSSRWSDPEEVITPVPIPAQEPVDIMTDERVLLGRFGYVAMGCQNCHGMTGSGNGPSAATLKDDWDRPVKAYNYHQGAPKGGATPLDVYRTFRTGVTPMPMYQSDTLSFVTRDMKASVFPRLVPEEQQMLEAIVDSLPTQAQVMQWKEEDQERFEEYANQRAWDLVAYTLWLRELGHPERAAIWPTDAPDGPPAAKSDTADNDNAG
ncbi:MAG: cytochrome c [Planctomycetes bacterium]|nr:cytochrome c [Planctomycetota bacterium]